MTHLDLNTHGDSLACECGNREPGCRTCSDNAAPIFPCRLQLKVSGVFCLLSALLCVVVTISTTVVHMNRLQTLRECFYRPGAMTCTCVSAIVDPVKAMEGDETGEESGGSGQRDNGDRELRSCGCSCQ